MQSAVSTDVAPVLLGVKGWDWPTWDAGFYPADMPPEWRLTYFNTQFPCVFLPETHWRGVAAEDILQWREDTHAHFLFLLEGHAGTAPPQALHDRALCLPARDECIVWFDARSDLRTLTTHLRQPSAQARFLISEDGDLVQLERVRMLLQLLGAAAPD
ncbi:MAG TPA: hypothetical protein PKJ96_01765 [Thiobacillaceae bacterium]|nr:hypothetical protein [Thiobacillaceae bacterium]